jgi:hypothetical protein
VTEENREKFHNWYFLPDIIRKIKSKSMRWAGHEALTRELKIHTKY